MTDAYCKIVMSLTLCVAVYVRLVAELPIPFLCSLSTHYYSTLAGVCRPTLKLVAFLPSHLP